MSKRYNKCILILRPIGKSTSHKYYIIRWWKLVFIIYTHYLYTSISESIRKILRGHNHVHGKYCRRRSALTAITSSVRKISSHYEPLSRIPRWFCHHLLVGHRIWSSLIELEDMTASPSKILWREVPHALPPSPFGQLLRLPAIPV